MSIIQGTSKSSAAGYSIDQSIRFNDNDSAYLYRTPSAGNRKTWTWSAWVKRGNFTGATQRLWGSTPSSGSNDFNYGGIYFSSADTLDYGLYGSSFRVSTAKFRDPSAWYHIVVALDTTQATASNRLHMYVNGVELTSFSISNDPALNTDYSINQNAIHTLGSAENFSALYKLDGYLAEIHFIDGQQLDPTSFGEVNSDTGQWVPIKYTGSATGNSFYITGKTASDLGEDFSGNNNDWTSSGLGAADQMSDSPTNNWCTLSPLSSPLTRSSAMSEGNLKWRNTSDGTSFYIGCAATQRVLGKCYWEVTNTYDGTGTIRTGLFPRAFLIQNDYPGGAFGADCIGLVATIGRVDRNGVAGTTYTGAGSGDVNMYAFDEDAGKLWIGLNGTWFNSGDPAGGTGEVAGSIVQSPLFPATSGYGTSSGNFQEFNFGQSAFAHTVPTGFLPLDSSNLPDPTIALPENHFTSVLYEGNGGGQRVGQFQPITETYTVPNSVIFNDDDTPYMQRTPSSAGNDNTWTFSCWIKRGSDIGSVNTQEGIIGAGDGGGSPARYDNIGFYNDKIQFFTFNGFGASIQTTAVYRDPSAWYHLVIRYDDTQATAADRVRIYVNGVVQALNSPTFPSQNYGSNFNTTYLQRIGANTVATNRGVDGYLSEIIMVDGQSLDPSSFGQLDASTNRWIPKDASGLTFGTNGFYLDMETAPGTGSGAGTDSSGNGNNFTESGLAAADQVDDSPTKNFAVLDANGSLSSNFNLSEGNLSFTMSYTADWVTLPLTFPAPSGKFYVELKAPTLSNGLALGFCPSANFTPSLGQTFAGLTGGKQVSVTSGGTNEITANGQGATTSDPSITGAANDILLMAIDLDAGEVYFGVYDDSAATTYWIDSSNGTTGNPSTGSNPTFTFTAGTEMQFGVSCRGSSVQGFLDAGSQGYSLTPPTGFNTLNNDNLPLTGAGLSGFVWIKNRDAADNHMLFDAVRGATKDMHSNAVNAEVTNVNTLQRFLLNGFEVGNDVEVNTSGESYVAWQWLYNNLTASSNTDGSVISSVLANTTAGFSIVGYAGNSTIGATVGHGLGAKTPAMIIVKQRTTATNSDWTVYHQSFGNTGGGYLNSSAVFTTASWWNNTSPTSSVFTVDNSGRVNGSGNNYIAYCFAEVDGFSAFKSYVGNANANGPVINLGFRPAWVLIKQATTSARDWIIQDATRNPYNVANLQLLPNTSQAEATTFFSQSAEIDILSNGFKVRSSAARVNESGATYIVAAFAESPFKTANAR